MRQEKKRTALNVTCGANCLDWILTLNSYVFRQVMQMPCASVPPLEMALQKLCEDPVSEYM